MVGDYISTSFAGGNVAFPVFAVAKAPTRGTFFDERMYSARFDVTFLAGAARPWPARAPHPPLPPHLDGCRRFRTNRGELARRNRPLQPGS